MKIIVITTYGGVNGSRNKIGQLPSTETLPCAVPIITDIIIMEVADINTPPLLGILISPCPLFPARLNLLRTRATCENESANGFFIVL